MKQRISGPYFCLLPTMIPTAHQIITAPEPVLRSQCLLGEGPVWDVEKKLLYFVDILKVKTTHFSPHVDMID